MMKYSESEALREIVKRSERLREAKKRRRSGVCLALSAVLVCALTFILARLAPEAEPLAVSGAYGAFLLPEQTGWYVLVAVCAFAAGVLFTVGVRGLQSRDKNDKE